MSDQPTESAPTSSGAPPPEGPPLATPPAPAPTAPTAATPPKPPRPRPAIGLSGPGWIRPSYYYLACLLGILIGAYGALTTAQGVVHLISPDLGAQGDPITRLVSTAVELIDVGVTTAADQTDDDEAEESLETISDVLDSTRDELRSQTRKAALDQLLRGLILLAIGIAVYRYHWLRVEPEADPVRAGPGQSVPGRRSVSASGSPDQPGG
jgi:hypothetical protein